MRARIRDVEILRRGQATPERDHVAVEEPMAVRVNLRELRVIMRTPVRRSRSRGGVPAGRRRDSHADEIGLSVLSDTTDAGRDNTIMHDYRSAFDRLKVRLR